MSSLTVNQKLRDLISRCIKNFIFFASKQLKIASKTGKLEPFVLNDAQRYIHERIEKQLEECGQVRAIILKGRQQGASTYVEGRFYWKVRFRKAVRAFILTHLQEATDNLFAMVERYHNNLNALLRPETSSDNAKELKFKANGSGYKVSTAGSKGTGRSSTIHYFHGSEVAFWPNAKKHAAGVLQAVPQGNKTEIILESTANGIGGYFHTQWRKAERGESEFIAIFVPWFWQKEYRKTPPPNFVVSKEEQRYADIYSLDIEQIVWMHDKNIELDGETGDIGWLFLQEYPFCPADAFQASGTGKICDTRAIAAARVCKIDQDRRGQHLLGVDPARMGSDRSSIIHRRGRVAWGLESHKKLRTTELAAIIIKIIEDCAAAGDPIDAVFVDEVGIGAGVADILIEKGYGSIVVEVNAGKSADNPDLYINKRVEMWDRMANWISDAPCSIPDLDSLHADLVEPSYTYNTSRKKVLQSKDEMEISPDEAEALALTFSYAVDNLSVYADQFNEPLHFANCDYWPAKSSPVIFGISPGIYACCVIGQVMGNGQLRIIDELSMGGGGFEAFVKHDLAKIIADKYRSFERILVVSPEIRKGELANDFRTLLDAGYDISYAPSGMKSALIANGRHWLSGLAHKGAAALSVGKNCNVVRQGFLGAYKFKQGSQDVAESRHASFMEAMELVATMARPEHLAGAITSKNEITPRKVADKLTGY
ncbi:MAG TPA: hypothetical protein VN030_13815 [Cellvibrio sp.]|nr:hypothetical protein [Cellvibrio sp.]